MPKKNRPWACADALSAPPVRWHAVAVTRPLHLWLLGDGKPGHENQSLGLAEAIGRRVPCESHWLRIGGSRLPWAAIRRAMAAARGLPRPDLIMAAGHATHLPLLALARSFRAPSVVLMKPSLPLGWFDLCIAPQHDFPAGSERPGLILTRGALNRVRPGGTEREGRLLLIGGPSKTHGWDDPALLEMIRQIAKDPASWRLGDSRRTPAGFIEQVRRQIPGLQVISHRDTPPDWVPETLQASREVWVTEDSVSMIYEALSSGARVGLLPLPRLRAEARVLAGIDQLLVENRLTPFATWRETGQLSGPNQPLAEADRCAGLVIERLLPARKS